MEGMGTEAFAMAPYASQLPNQVSWRCSSGPIRRTANSKTSINSLAPSHHGEAGAARPSSAEAFLRAVESERVAICEGEKTPELWPKQIHLGRLRRLDVEDWGGWRWGLSWSRLGVAVKKLSQFLEVLTKRFEHAALVQGCGWMKQGEEDKVFQVERLAAYLCNSHLPFQQCLRRPIP
jgi:hypothetical protein